MSTQTTPDQHSFVKRPNKTVLTLSVPIFFSLIAEPLTGLIDTGFVSDLGSSALAALGVATTAFSALFWTFNFLPVGTQTEVALALGRNQKKHAAELTSLALVMGIILSLFLIVIFTVFAVPISAALGAEGEVLDSAVTYIRIRAWGAPALLIASISFGALRGAQEMKSPMYITVALNAINIVLDAIFIKGWGAIPAYGIAGAAAASVFAQWVGAIAALYSVNRIVGLGRNVEMGDFGRFLQIGGDMFIRSGLLTLFLLLTTRIATRIGAEAGAAHQAIRQIWLFTALSLDAVAMTAQSLVGYFLGADWRKEARRVALYCSVWSLVMGLILMVGMWFGTDVITRWLVPDDAIAIFGTAWLLALITQPGNAIAFVTDGIHLGSGDFRFLRNVQIVAMIVGGALLFLIDTTSPNALRMLWTVTAVWVAVRAFLGIIRIWPGIGNNPFQREPSMNAPP